MGNRRGGNILMALGVVLALIGGGLTFVITQTATSKPAKEPDQQVVVAQVDFPVGTIITADKVQVQNWPQSIVPAGSVSSLTDLNGKFAKTQIAAHTPLVVSELGAADLSKITSNVGAGVPPVAAKATNQVDPEFTLDKGQVLVVVDYPSAAGLIKAGAIHAGSVVDVIVRTPGAAGDQIAPIFRAIKVRAVGSLDPAKVTEDTTALIFAVAPQDALILKFMESMNPDLLLRAAGDTASSATDLVTLDYMTRRFNLERTLTQAATSAPAPAPAPAH